MLLSPEHIFLSTYDEVRQLCVPLQQFDIYHFSYTKSFISGQRVYLSTDPEILEDYFRQNFYLLGACEYDPARYKKQMLLWSTLPRQVMYELSKQKGLVEGIFIVQPNKGYTEFFNFASKNKNIINTYLTYVDVLKKFIDYFKIQAKSLIKKCENENFFLPYKNEIFNLIHPYVEQNEFWHIASNVKLTKRQYDCARKILEGHSAKEIAKALQLSHRTVEAYVQHLKSKFAVTTKTELILHLAKFIEG